MSKTTVHHRRNPQSAKLEPAVLQPTLLGPIRVLLVVLVVVLRVASRLMKRGSLLKSLTVFKVGVKATLALCRPCPRPGCNEREVNKVKHSVTDSCPLLVNQ